MCKALHYTLHFLYKINTWCRQLGKKNVCLVSIHTTRHKSSGLLPRPPGLRPEPFGPPGIATGGISFGKVMGSAYL